MSQLTLDEYQNWENQWSRSTIPVTQYMIEGTILPVTKSNQNINPDIYYYDDTSGPNTDSAGSTGGW